MSERAAEGAIYDLGYQRYAGARLGRAYAMRTLFTHSLRAAFGIGRGDKARTIPVLIIALITIPALIQVGVASAAGMTQMLSYSNQLGFTALLLTLFAAGQAPELVVTDRQNGTLALYLSRPLTSIDYALAKLSALWSAMMVLTVGPQLMLFIGRVFLVDKPWPAFVAEWTKLFPIVGGSMLISLSIAAISLALASYATRRGYASASVIAFFLICGALSQMVQTVATGSVRKYSILANPATLIQGFSGWLFEIEASRRTAVGRADIDGVLYFYVLGAVSVVGVVLLLRRYRSQLV